MFFFLTNCASGYQQVCFCLDEVAHNISKVGVLLGSTDTSVSKSINNLKHGERSRLHVLPKQKELHASSKQLDYDLTDSEDELDLLAINQLYGEIVEGMSEGEPSDLQVVPRKNKSSSKKKKKLGKKKQKENL
jgi:hypothetical protein